MDIGLVGHRQYAERIARRDWWREFLLDSLLPTGETVLLVWAAWHFSGRWVEGMWWRVIVVAFTAACLSFFALLILSPIHRAMWRLARRLYPAFCLTCGHFEEEYTILLRPLEECIDCHGFGRIVVSLGEEPRECHCVGPTAVVCTKCMARAQDVTPWERRLNIPTNGRFYRI